VLDFLFALKWGKVIRMDRPLDEYLKHADDLAQHVLNAWGSNWHAGNRNFTPAFNTLLEDTFRYWDAKRIAENHREFGPVSEKIAGEEREFRLAFARAYKKFWERHEKN
jgi:hypothetical protein